MKKLKTYEKYISKNMTEFLKSFAAPAAQLEKVLWNSEIIEVHYTQSLGSNIVETYDIEAWQEFYNGNSK